MTTTHTPRTPGAEGHHDDVVYKICPTNAWVEALRSGELFPSPDDIRDGFVHLSAKSQVRNTLARHYAGETDLMLLSVAVAKLPTGTLHWEKSHRGQEFPHLYGALAVSSVLEATPLGASVAGFELPEGF